MEGKLKVDLKGKLKVKLKAVLEGRLKVGLEVKVDLKDVFLDSCYDAEYKAQQHKDY